MTHTESFISDAIKGGWRNLAPICFDVVDMEPFIPDFIDGNQITLQVILLDPLAWQAVGKTRNWATTDLMNKPVFQDREPSQYFFSNTQKHPTWRIKLLHFIDHLADGDTIEEALSKIT